MGEIWGWMWAWMWSSARSGACGPLRLLARGASGQLKAEKVS